jgi:two-component system sensor histidine kinase TctE
LREQSPEKMNASLEQLVKGSERATRLVNQMLALARAERSLEPHTSIVELNVLARQQTLEWVETAIHKHIDLGFEAATQTVSVRGNALMLAELLNNLVDNALLYTPAQGRVTVRVGSDPDRAFLEVEDSGPGISLENQQRVFDRFFRVLGSEVDGSGLGLSIVKEIAEHHQAQIEFMKPTPRAGNLSGTRLRISFSHVLPDDEAST